MTYLPLQYQKSNEWNVLAMLQSMTIYILIRIFDEGSFTVDFDNQMIETMTVSTFADLMPHPPQLADNITGHSHQIGTIRISLPRRSSESASSLG
jgi:hypothetical protein